MHPNHTRVVRQRLSPCRSGIPMASHHPDRPPAPVHTHMSHPSHGVNRILSRNINGTIAMTSHPSNESELQLYRVLQRANLLAYYDTFICQGGDDVQQLCEAGEEEFLEIMALVGMASKPLHVRRLQKALQEWVSNPAMFQGPPPGFPGGPVGIPPSLPPGSSASPSDRSPGRPGIHSMPSQHPSSQPLALPAPPLSSAHHLVAERLAAAAANSRRSPINLSNPGTSRGIHDGNGPVSFPRSSPSGRRVASSPSPSGLPSGSNGGGRGPRSDGSSHSTPSPTHHAKSLLESMAMSLGHQTPGSFTITSTSAREGLITNEYGQPASPISLTPILLDSQIQRLSDAAEALVKSLPPMDVKLANNKKRISRELEHVMNMSEDDPRRLDEIRKYAAIYGRFDCKRKPEKPLTLHEVSVNEAAAQICKHIPVLLSRRDELFPLARQVVRDSGYQYSKGHSRSQLGSKRSFDEALNSGSNCSNSKYFNSSGSIDGGKGDTDDTDSQYSLYSNPNSDSNDAASQADSSREGNTREGQDTEGNALPSVTTPDSFSKLLPAKKSGNFGSASQLAKQLVQETLLDEGLRVVKEFSSDTPSKDTSVIPSPPDQSLKRKEEPMFQVTPNPDSCRESLMTPPSLRDAFPGMTRPAIHQPRPRGRPPKNAQPQMTIDHHHHMTPHSGFRDLRSSLEAAYHAEVAEKLQQHFQQTFLANQYSQQMMAAANGFAGIRRIQESFNNESNKTSVKTDSNGEHHVTHINSEGTTNGDPTPVGSFRGTSSSPKPILSQASNESPGKTINRSLEELESCLNASSTESKSNGNGMPVNSLESLLE